MFGFGGIFGRKPRQFDYRPRYYDAEKEAREQRKRAVLGSDYADKYMTDEEREQERRNYKPGAYIRNSMMERRGIGSSRRGNGTTVRRLVIVAVLIVLAAAWVLSTDSIDIALLRWLGK
jgi:hypothetical protein